MKIKKERKVWKKGTHPRKKGPGVRHAQGVRTQKWATVEQAKESLAQSTLQMSPDVIRRSKYKRPGVLRKVAE